ncbi:MAG: CPCC family cysteine-rich protein [Cyclobacteriaceae bacterium]
MKLDRKNSIKALSYLDLINLNEFEKENILIESNFQVTGEGNSLESDIEILLGFIESSYKGVKNEYLEKKLSDIYKSNVIVLGIVENFFPCNCCNFKTLESSGEYFICPVCFWEDDGLTDPEKYSSVNGMFLKQAKSNFETIGCISSKYIDKVDKNGKEKYYKITK